MKTIAVFGGSGQTGQHFIQQALAQGYAIKALVRNSTKLILKDPLLEIIQGDVLDRMAVEKTVIGSSVVVSLFGHVKGSPARLQTNGTSLIVDAMKKYEVDKIISLSGGGLPFPEKDEPKFADKMIRTIMRIAVPKVLDDAIEHHQVLVKSGLQWIIVRGPRLSNAAPRGSYRVGWVGVNASTQIARADLADFILKQVDDDQFLYQMPFVSY